jgi:hypothetical protein
MTQSPSSSIIRLHRLAGPWRDRLVRYRVFIDDIEVGRIAEGETCNFHVNPAQHGVRLTFSKIFMSRRCTVTLGQGDVARFTCGPGGPAVESIFTILRPHRYISLEGPLKGGEDMA